MRLPRLDVGPVDLRDFRQTGRLPAAGYAAGRAAVQAEAVSHVPRQARAC